MHSNIECSTTKRSQSGLVTFSSKFANFDKKQLVNIHQKPYHYLITKEEEIILDEIVSNLSNDYNLSFDNEPTFNFKKFETFQHYSDIKTLSSINFNNQFKILIINIEHHFIGGRHGDSIHNENQILGVKMLEKDYGRILIREENVFDKILEAFNKTEIDFKDDKKFSDRFFVVAEEENKAKQFLNSEIREILTSIPKKENFSIEVFNNELIISNKKTLNRINFNQIINFLKNNL